MSKKDGFSKSFCTNYAVLDLIKIFIEDIQI